MKIAIDIETLQSGKAGIATVVKALCRQFKRHRRNVVFLTYHKSQGTKTPFRRLYNALRHLFYILVQLPLKLHREHVDVLIGPAFYVPLWMPKRCRSIVIIYDVIPKTRPQGLDGLNVLYRNTLGRLCARQADRVITLSRHSRREIHRHLGVAPSRIVVAEGATSEFWRPAPCEERRRMREKFDLSPRGYFLFIGSDHPYKNAAGLVRAHSLCAAGNTDFPVLVIAGGGSTLRREGRGTAVALDFASPVIFTGYVSLAELRALYSDAAALVLPSLAEGFGLPVLEAMACETPVICSNVASLPEVAGDAAILIDPKNTRQIAEAMQRLARDAELREELIRRGRRRVRRFSWSRFARRIHELAAALHGGPPARRTRAEARRAA